ncbi:heme-binding protein 1 [Procambarus clarkii]|uniref:heme-binding protein 1 n=1 Tax=Procambarus clarkii TaxID=6728 RepID=UPI001E672B5D|nr:heme-binding protein 1-like [Procambarus clarkii]
MRVVVLTLVFGLAATSCQAAPEADFFGGMDEHPSEVAPYTVIKDAETYEVRVYEQTKWVCSEVIVAKPHPKDAMKMFWALYHYISGENSKGLEMNMTAPVTLLDEEYEGSQKRCQTCFYLPAAHQQDPPMPSDQSVYIEDRPRLRLAARTFGGLVMTLSEWEAERKKLIADLQKHGEETVDTSRHYGAMYDPPMKKLNRRNEVWYVFTRG